MFDGQIVTANPDERLSRGQATHVPILIGSTTADLPGTLPPANNPFSYFGANAATARTVYDPKGTMKPLAALLTIGVDITMHEPARFAAKQMTNAGQPAWLYRFGYVAQSLRPKAQGASHASELPYLFDTLDVRYGKNVTQKDREAGREFRSYIVNFIKTGNPNGAGLPQWTQYSPTRSNLMIFTPDRGPGMSPDPLKARLDLVERVANEQPSSSNAANKLAGTSWQLVKFQGGDDRVLTPDSRIKYTITFNADSSVNVRFDCNRGRGTWKSSGPNQLQFGPLALTRALCPPNSLHDRLVKDWGYVRSYVIKNGHLFLSLMADGGIYELEPLTPSQSVTPK